MADTRFRIRSETLPIRVESGRLILPEDIGSEIRNMYLTDEGTLRSVWGPCPLVPQYVGLKSILTYGQLHGIFHTRFAGGEREILLIQEGDGIKVFEGWTTAGGAGTPWRLLLGPTASSPQRAALIESDRKPRFPTQFERTPIGVVIIPSGANSRAYFYDGREVLPLGYSSPPAAPTGSGPSDAVEAPYDWSGSEIDRLMGSGVGNDDQTMPRKWGNSRVGTVSTESTGTGGSGRVKLGSYRAAVQWIDRWGNLSPISGRSAPVTIPAVDSTFIEAITEVVDQHLYELLWQDINSGPEGTVGRIILRTKDELNSGTLKLFEVPANAAGGTLSYATITDNLADAFPDNTADSWLIQEAREVVAVTPFKLYKVAFGRGWAANFEDRPGMLVPTMPGRWGTFMENEQIYPDARGGEITGLASVEEGLLVFTQGSTFRVEPNQEGTGFRTRSLHNNIGCVAPSSIAALPNGGAVWLGDRGFYQYMGGEISLISDPIYRDLKRINKARRIQSCAVFDIQGSKYRCWVPMDASETNNLCWEYDGEGWTRRDDVEAAAVCVTGDHRQYSLVAGKENDTHGVWVLDHQVSSHTPATRSSVVQTAWLRAARSHDRGSPTTVYLWFRETSSGKLTVDVQRDYRSDITQTAQVFLHPQDDFPPFWGPTDASAAKYGGTDATGDAVTWERRRPYWIRADIFVPSAEVFRLKISHTGDWEFLGLAVDEIPKDDTFRSAPK